jgi:hypothetical protein
LCLNDEKVAIQLKKRRELLCAHVLPALTSIDKTNPNDLVWVDASFLRQFISCKDLFVAQIEHKAIPFQRDILCTHENPALHPRIARRGKLLPKQAYDALMDIIDNEIQDSVGTGILNPIKGDLLISPLRNLVCKCCVQEYRSELVEKLSFVRSVKYLFDKFDPKEMNHSRYIQPGDESMEKGDQFVYIVSRKFITWFRNKTMRLMKQATMSKADPKLQTDIHGSTSSIHEGLDGLNLKEFWDFDESMQTFCNVRACGVGEDEGIAIRVNGPLTCTLFYFILTTNANKF